MAINVSKCIGVLYYHRGTRLNAMRFCHPIMIQRKLFDIFPPDWVRRSRKMRSYFSLNMP